MSDDTNDSSTTEEAKKKPRKRKVGKRKAIYVLIPHDIDDVSKSRQEAYEPDDEPAEDNSVEKVWATKLDSDFHVYIVPGGVGQKAAILGVLKKHNVDLKNIDRVRMFKGEKKFSVETQYNIRF